MKQLTRCRALIEAELDFPEEEDVPGSVSDSVWKTVRGIAGEIDSHLAKRRSAEIIRDGFKIVIAGRPNAGKSSLLNALAKREVAIVTEIEGTTRDLISVDLDISGYLVRLTDTAGLRETDDRVEREGLRRAVRSMAEADLVLVLRDANDTADYPQIVSTARILRIITKVDTRPDLVVGVDEICISSSEGLGIDSLTKRILDELGSVTNFTGEATAVRARQVELLQEVRGLLNRKEESAGDLELRAEDLRQASHLLGKITGFVDVEDLLDVVFSEFCIGK
jgi:tRNA modification GTPase